MRVCGSETPTLPPFHGYILMICLRTTLTTMDVPSGQVMPHFQANALPCIQVTISPNHGICKLDVLRTAEQPWLSWRQSYQSLAIPLPLVYVQATCQPRSVLHQHLISTEPIRIHFSTQNSLCVQLSLLSSCVRAYTPAQRKLCKPPPSSPNIDVSGQVVVRYW